jgi:FAD:protein FMN transferase
MRRPAPVAPSADGTQVAALIEGRAHRFSGPTMGTTFNVTVVGALDVEAQAVARDAVGGALRAVNTEMSTYQKDSALSRFNRHASTAPFPASEALRTVMREASRISGLSGGAVDVKKGPLVRPWG